MLKESHEKPPIWDMLIKAIPSLHWDQGVIVTYGDTAYSKDELSNDLKVHESVHVRQQALIGKDEWWKQWLADTNFRLHQELEAYQEQFDYLKKEYAALPRNERRFKLNRMAEWIAGVLSSDMYGRMITYNKALELIK